MTDYTTMAATSRVWIYQSNQLFSKEQLPEINAKLEQFVNNWVAHSRQLRAFGKVFHQRFIVLMVDESSAGASGCSIDASVHFIQKLETAYNVNMFDRLLFSYKENGVIKTAHREQFTELYQGGYINDKTLVFDNLVKTKEDFDTAWIKPLGNSWHKRMV